MKQLTAAVYLSFAFLFIFLQSFDNYYSTNTTYLITILFFLLASIYFISAIKDFLKNLK